MQIVEDYAIPGADDVVKVCVFVYLDQTIII